MYIKKQFSLVGSGNAQKDVGRIGISRNDYDLIMKFFRFYTMEFELYSIDKRRMYHHLLENMHYQSCT